MTKDIASITVLVPFVKDNSTHNDIIPFRVYEHAGAYVAIPTISDAEREQMKLSERLSFKIMNDRIIPQTEHNHEIIYRIVSELRLLQIF